MTQQPKTFNPNEHLIQLRSKEGSKDYLPVQWRLVWFRELCPQGTIDTEELEVDLDREVESEVYVWNSQKGRSEKVIKKARGYARYKAIVTDGRGGRGTGTKSEKASDFDDYIEKSETGAIGRALASLGYGTQFATDLAEGHRIVDSPVDREEETPRVPASPGTPPPPPNQGMLDSELPITDQQISSIRKLSEYLGKSEPEGLTSFSNLEGKKLIQGLTVEYRQSKKAS